MAKRLPPNGFTGKVHVHEPHVGGAHRMSFTSLGTGESRFFVGEFLELVPPERIRRADRFDDPNLPGEMPVTITIRKVLVGAGLEAVQEGVADSIPPEACDLGWQESPALLVEADLPG